MWESCLDFIIQLGDEAHRLCWTAKELFDVHSDHGMLRVEYCGALMISGHRAQGVEPLWVAFKQGRCCRDKLGQVWGVLVWEFAAKSGIK